MEKSARLRSAGRRRPGARTDQPDRHGARACVHANRTCACCRRSPTAMSVALENARLFDETQRLFKQSEQRAAELAIINSVQQGLAAELDFQAISISSATRSREIFDSAGHGDRAWYEPQHEHASTTCTEYEHGERLYPIPSPLATRASPRTSSDTRRRSSINENIAERDRRSTDRVVAGTRRPRSRASTCRSMAGDQARGSSALATRARERLQRFRRAAAADTRQQR